MVCLMALEEKRLVEIESALAHMEQLTESLNETVIEQDKTIRRLSQQVEQLSEHLADTDMKSIKDNITKPPHYQ
ncbi:MAG: SlyX family protein [Verrucomicrobiota bacterium]|nr:SlyX family protein [Verrucomicrobiota bacterium]